MDTTNQKKKKKHTKCIRGGFFADMQPIWVLWLAGPVFNILYESHGKEENLFCIFFFITPGESLRETNLL